MSTPSNQEPISPLVNIAAACNLRADEIAIRDEEISRLRLQVSQLQAELKMTKMITELNVFLRQELDLESYLRTALEVILHHIGATNIAIGIPSNNEDEYKLGAYANLNLQPASVETYLESGIVSLACEFMKNNTNEKTWNGAAETDYLGNAHIPYNLANFAVGIRYKTELLGVLWVSSCKPINSENLDYIRRAQSVIALGLDKLNACESRGTFE